MTRNLTVVWHPEPLLWYKCWGGKCEAYFHLVLLFLGEPVGRRALPEAAAVVWEAASTVPDPSAQQHSNTEQEVRPCYTSHLANRPSDSWQSLCRRYVPVKNGQDELKYFFKTVSRTQSQPAGPSKSDQLKSSQFIFPLNPLARSFVMLSDNLSLLTVSLLSLKQKGLCLCK